MKNIHALPTDKPTGVFKTKNTLMFSIINKTRSNNEGFYIYITSDEEIKYNDYITDSYRVWQWKDDSSLFGRKKIILTTDQDLINDGVQAIDDEFLEWFVKNPSCEEVDVRFYCIGFNRYNPIGEYKIILPKEELYDRTTQSISLSEVDKEETLEEDNIVFITKEQAVRIFGAKKLKKMTQKQNKNKYSEEDMIEAIMFGANGMYGWQIGEEGYTDNQIKRFLETFKNK